MDLQVLKRGEKQGMIWTFRLNVVPSILDADIPEECQSLYKKAQTTGTCQLLEDLELLQVVQVDFLFLETGLVSSLRRLRRKLI